MKTFLTILVIIIIVGGIALLIKNNKGGELEVVYPNESDTTDDSATVPAGSPAQNGVDLSVQTGGTILPAPVLHTVTYTSAGFSPATTTINAGDTVKFVNNTSGAMWVASDPHPQHTDYSPFDAKKGYAAGTSYSYTFTTAGTYDYHDHLHSSMKGTVIVK